MKHAGLRLFAMKSCGRKACPLSSGMRNRVDRTSFVWYDVSRKVCLPSFIRYDESCRLDGRPVQSCAKREYVFVHPVRGIKQARLCLSGQSRAKVVLIHVQPEGGINLVGLCLSGTKLRRRSVCPHLSGTRNHAGGT